MKERPAITNVTTPPWVKSLSIFFLVCTPKAAASVLQKICRNVSDSVEICILKRLVLVGNEEHAYKIRANVPNSAEIGVIAGNRDLKYARIGSYED